jgi:hypothetical protein
VLIARRVLGLTPKKPMTAKQRAYLKHKRRERTRQQWNETVHGLLGTEAPLQPIKACTDRAWAAFSKFIRLRDNGRCYTCSKQMDWKKMHAGHFIHAGRRNPASYDERNVHCQCPTCNTYLHGNLAVYAKYMAQWFGLDVIDDLRVMKATGDRLSRTELTQIAQKYEALVDEML